MENILNKCKVSVYEIENTKTQTFINTRIKKIFVINLADNIIRRNYILTMMKKYNINFSLVVVNRINEKIHSYVGNEKITKEELGCTLSHMLCLREIIKNNYENAIIFEDDIIFHKNFKSLFIDIFKNDYDFLLLGACDFSFQSLNKEMLHDNKKKHNTRVKLNIDDESITSEEESEDDNNSPCESKSFGSGTTIMFPEIQIINEPIKKNMYRPHINAKRVYGAHANYYSLEGAKKMFSLESDNISFFDKCNSSMFESFKNTSFICYPNLVVTDISTSSLNHNYPFFSKSEELYYINCFDNFIFTDYNFIYLDIILKHKGVEIDENDTYESFMTRLIGYQFSNQKEREILKNRQVLDFFTVRDLEKIRLNI